MNTKPPRSTNRGQLQQLISGLSEGVILVDRNADIVWANEAALVMHGVETMAALGGTPAGYRKHYQLRYRNYHKLTPSQYPLDRLLAEDAFRDVVVEVNRVADPQSRWVHQVRSLILTDEDGNADCLALVLEDVTEQTNAEERFEQAFKANPAPGIICRLSDLRYIRVNPGFLDMTGYASDAIIGHSVYEIDVLADAERRELAIQRLNEGRTIPQMEASLPLLSGEAKLVIVAGQPIELDEEPCMLFTFADLDPRRQAENALRQSEARFAKSFRLTPVPTIIFSTDLHILDVNDAFSTIFGYGTEDVIGRSASRLGLFTDTAVRPRLNQALRENDSIRNWELSVRTRDGIVLDCLLSAGALEIQDEPCLLVVLQDISERKRTEAQLFEAIETVMQDTSWFSRTVIEKLANIRTSRGGTGGRTQLADLTAREKEVLTLICRGHADKQIANTLDLSVHTIRNHVAAIYSKIDVHKRGAAIIWARERGLGGSEADDSEG